MRRRKLMKQGSCWWGWIFQASFIIVLQKHRSPKTTIALLGRMRRRQHIPHPSRQKFLNRLHPPASPWCQVCLWRRHSLSDLKEKKISLDWFQVPTSFSFLTFFYMQIIARSNLSGLYFLYNLKQQQNTFFFFVIFSCWNMLWLNWTQQVCFSKWSFRVFLSWTYLPNRAGRKPYLCQEILTI